MENNDNFEMDVFMGEDFIEDNSELEQELEILNPSEDVDPEIVASTNQDGEDSNTPPSIDDVEEEEEDKSEPSGNTSIYSSLANVLYEKGVFPNLDLEKSKIDDIDDLAEVMAAEIKANELAGMNDRQKRYLEALKEGVPEELFQETEKVNMSLENLTDEVLEDEENSQVRADLIKEYFLLKGMDVEEADSLTQQQIDLATDVEFSKKARKVIGAFNNSRLDDRMEEARAAKVKQKEDFDSLKKSIYDTNSIIEGISISKKDKDAVLDIISKPVETLQDGRQMNQIMKAQVDDPIGFQHKLAYLIHVTDGFKDFSKFTSGKKAASKATKDLERLLKKSTFDVAGEGSFDPDSIDLGDLNFDL